MALSIFMTHRPTLGPVSQLDFDLEARRLEVTWAATGDVYAYVVSYDSFLTLVNEPETLAQHLRTIQGSRLPGVVARGERLADLHPERMEVTRESMPVTVGTQLHAQWRQHLIGIEARAAAAVWTGGLYG